MKKIKAREKKIFTLILIKIILKLTNQIQNTKC